MTLTSRASSTPVADVELAQPFAVLSDHSKQLQTVSDSVEQLQTNFRQFQIVSNSFSARGPALSRRPARGAPNKGIKDTLRRGDCPPPRLSFTRRHRMRRTPLSFSRPSSASTSSPFSKKPAASPEPGGRLSKPCEIAKPVRAVQTGRPAVPRRSKLH
jgi:hypothetical protein